MERVGENLYVQDGRGNLIRLYTTPPPAATVSDKEAPLAAYLTPLGPSSSSKAAEGTGAGELSFSSTAAVGTEEKRKLTRDETKMEVSPSDKTAAATSSKGKREKRNPRDAQLTGLADEADDSQMRMDEEFVETSLVRRSNTAITSLRPPQDYVLPRDHPWAVDFLAPDEAIGDDAWKSVWRDDFLVVWIFMSADFFKSLSLE